MINRRQRKRKGPLADINVVPYIDVMLVLLVIFMITAPLLTQGVSVNLPHAAAKALPPKKELPIIVSVDSAGNYFLNVAKRPQQSIAPSALAAEVSSLVKAANAHNETRDVYVKGDRQANYGKVVNAMVLLQHAGVDHVGLVTDPTS
jgi:biopolymer transport protein TolR